MASRVCMGSFNSPVCKGLIAEEVQVSVHSAPLSGAFAHELLEILSSDRGSDATDCCYQLMMLALFREGLLASNCRLMLIWNPGCNACIKGLIEQAGQDCRSLQSLGALAEPLLADRGPFCLKLCTYLSLACLMKAN